MNTKLLPIAKAIKRFAAGNMIILVDDEDRENEGDLVIAAEDITDEAVNFMATHGRGLICMPMEAEGLKRLGIPMMVEHNTSKFETAFTVSIEAARNITTGISARDRAETIRVAVDPNSSANDIVMPGHIFPLRAKPGGVLARAGQTEGSVDLAKLAGKQPAAVICEIINDDGTMARMPDLEVFSNKHNIPIVTINDLIAYRMQHDSIVEQIAESNLPIRQHGEFAVKVFRETLTGLEHVVLSKGEIDPNQATLVRVHSECLTGDAFGSSRCDCGSQLDAAIARIATEGGVLLYMKQEGRGIGLANKILAYQLQDQGLDTVEANKRLGFQSDHRDYGIGSQILRLLGITKMRLLTNNPRKVYGIKGYGLEITSREPIQSEPTKDNLAYLSTKRDKMGHYLDLTAHPKKNS